MGGPNNRINFRQNAIEISQRDKLRIENVGHCILLSNKSKLNYVESNLTTSAAGLGGNAAIGLASPTAVVGVLDRRM